MNRNIKKPQYEDFPENDAWLIFRLDCQVQSQSVDIYMLMDLPSGMILTHEIASDLLSAEQATGLFQQGKVKKGRLPKRILLSKGDPADMVIRQAADALRIVLETPPASYLEDLIAPVKESYGNEIFSPSTIGYAALKDNIDESDRDSARQFVPDSYDFCSCASGRKFKFCCKPIFREIVGAMATAEEGKRAEALDYIAQAKKIVGETAEVLCREAVVHSFFDLKKAEQILEKCLSVNPNHPRAHYMRGIFLRDRGDPKGSAASYEKAIENYPKTDRYHLNEAYNNLGTAHYSMRNYQGAKAAWEQALLLLPSDKMVRQNLIEFIYSNPEVPEPLREMNPLVGCILKK